MSGRCGAASRFFSIIAKIYFFAEFILDFALKYEVASNDIINLISPTVFLSVRKQNLNLVSQGITEHLNKIRFIGEIDHCLDFDNGLGIELDCYFNSRGHNEEYFYQSNYWTFDFCVNKTFFKDALIVEAGVSDITNKECRDVKIFSSKGYQSVLYKKFLFDVYLPFQPRKIQRYRSRQRRKTKNVNLSRLHHFDFNIVFCFSHAPIDSNKNYLSRYAF